MTLPLTKVEHLTISPDQVKHALTEDGWSTFDFGPDRIQVPITDLGRVTAACDLAERIAAQAGFWASDLREIRDRLRAEDDARLNAPGSVTGPAPDPEPTMAAAIAAPDPELDAQVTKVATMPETRRAPARKPAKEKK